jgi:hypothetical protein
MNDRITIEGQDGAFGAYIARPKASPASAVVVLQELFGVNADIRKTCDELAEQGFIAVALDLTWFTPPGWINPAWRCPYHGRNRPSWKNACGSYCGSRMARVWPRGAASSASLGSPAIRSMSATPHSFLINGQGFAQLFVRRMAHGGAPFRS